MQIEFRRKFKTFWLLLRCFSFFGLSSIQILNAESFHSLGDVLALTLLNNPELNSYNYDIRAAEARILQASFRPNPGLDVETENIGAPIFVQNTILFSQLFELGGKRRARIQFAQTERDRATLDYEVIKRRLYVETALLFIEVLINQQKITFLEDNLNVLKNFSSVVEKRVESGKASIIEETNFAVMLNNAFIDVKNANNDLKIAKNKLAAKWGEPNNEAFIIVGTLDWTPDLISLEEMEGLIQEHPLLQQSYFEDNLRAARIALEKSKAYPDLLLRAGPRYLEEAHKWVGVVGVFIPLPINDRNQGRIRESIANFEKIEVEREALWNKLITELNTSYSTLQTVSSELALLKNLILPTTQKAYNFGYKGFEGARYNYLELLETERSYRTSKIRYLQALGEYHKALTILQGLTGSRAIINQQCVNL